MLERKGSDFLVRYEEGKILLPPGFRAKSYGQKEDHCPFAEIGVGGP